VREVIREVPVEKIVERIVEKPVEVIKEVLVEKIVEKIVEKPVEVVKEMRVFDEAKMKEETVKKVIGQRAAALAARQKRREEKLQKIIAFARAHRAVSNDDVQKLVAVSDRTAQNYLKTLVKQDKLKPSRATTGHGLYYLPV